MSNFDRLKRGCPVCSGTRKDLDCRQSNTTGLVHCRGRKGYEYVPGWEYIRDDAHGFPMWREEGWTDPDRYQSAAYAPATPRPAPRPVIPFDPTHHFSEFTNAEKMAQPMWAPSSWEELFVIELGLPSWACQCMFWRRYQDSWNRPCWAVREYGLVAGDVVPVAIHLRYPGGDKRSHGNPLLPDGTPARGVYLPTDWDRLPGPVVLPEGASDANTLAVLGIPAIGRPNNGPSGVDTIDYLLRREGADRSAIVLAENDHKPDGRWPGREGGIQAAQRLADLQGREVLLAFPPVGAKDVRSWYLAQSPEAQADLAELGRRFLTACTFEPIRPTRLPCGLVELPPEMRQEAPGAAQPVSQPDSRPEAGSAVLSDPGATGAVVPAAPPTPTVDLSDLAAEGTYLGTPPATPEEEAAAAEQIRQARRDHDHYHCPDCRPVVMKHDPTGEPWILEVRCEKHACEGCHRYLVERELINARLRFAQSVRAGRPLFELNCTAEQWPTIHRRIRRAKGQYLRVEEGDGYWVVTDVNVAPGTPTRPVDAAVTLRLLLDAYRGEGRLVSTSRGWCLPQPEEGPKVFSRVGKGAANLTPTVLIEIANHFEAEPVPVTPRRGPGKVQRAWRFMRVGGWDPAAFDRCVAALFDGEVLPALVLSADDWRPIHRPDVATTIADDLALSP